MCKTLLQKQYVTLYIQDSSLQLSQQNEAIFKTLFTPVLNHATIKFFKNVTGVKEDCIRSL